MPNFGVPQLRKRVIGLAALGRNPALQETHYAHGMPGASIAKEQPPVDGVLACLRNASILQGDDLMKDASCQACVQHIPPEEPCVIFSPKCYNTIRGMPPTVVSVMACLRKDGGAPVGMRRLIGSDPSKAITSAATREFIHPLYGRPFSTNEKSHYCRLSRQVTSSLGIVPGDQYLIGNAYRHDLQGNSGIGH